MSSQSGRATGWGGGLGTGVAFKYRLFARERRKEQMGPAITLILPLTILDSEGSVRDSCGVEQNTSVTSRKALVSLGV